MIASIRSMVASVVILGSPSLLPAPAIAATPQAISHTAATAGFSELPKSVVATTDINVGQFSSPQMSVEVVLAPGNASLLSGMLTNAYNPNSASYRNWLQKGQFNALFAPSSARVAAVAGYLRTQGLLVGRSASPFIVRATGTSKTVAAAFKTNLNIYRNIHGATYFSNASAVQLPSSFASGVLGVVGLTNTVRAHPQLKRPLTHPASPAVSCEAPYPTRAQLYAAVNDGTSFPFGYGASPGCNGLTPSQDNLIYGAPNVGPRGKGFGATLAVFELSAYKRSDIAAWAHTFYGPAFSAPLIDITVDGGPLSPICPTGDTCPPDFNGYSGDIEVDADIETQLAISPNASHLLVYNAPNDFTGQTELDQYSQIASDDLADVISSSWGLCENDAGAPVALAENVVFEQMALQGQSMFVAGGDTGAFGCIRGDGTTVLNVGDPASQPWVTDVGGTSLGSYNPGTDHTPSPPAPGVETVWNVDNLCNTSASEGGLGGLFWCAATGAGAGGNSQFWGRPFYQYGPGVTSPFTVYGNGTTQCSLAPVGTPCRENPDISINADEYTPYAEYCTGSAATPYSDCATFSGAQTPSGWFGIGGTSLSSPFLSAIFADRDSYFGSRSGNANVLLYTLYNSNPTGYFHDPTGIGQSTNNNGFFPTTRGYDEAVGIGVPKMSAIITGKAI